MLFRGKGLIVTSVCEVPTCNRELRCALTACENQGSIDDNETGEDLFPALNGNRGIIPQAC